MKIFKILVTTPTRKGRTVNVERIIRVDNDDVNEYRVRNYFSSQYIGFNIEVDEITEIDEFKLPEQEKQVEREKSEQEDVVQRKHLVDPDNEDEIKGYKKSLATNARIAVYLTKEEITENNKINEKEIEARKDYAELVKKIKARINADPKFNFVDKYELSSISSTYVYVQEIKLKGNLLEMFIQKEPASLNPN